MSIPLHELDTYRNDPTSFNNVLYQLDLSQDTFGRSSTSKALAQKIQMSIKKDIKFLLPLKKLCMRYLLQKNLVNYFHLSFLKVICFYQRYQFSRAVIQHPAYPEQNFQKRDFGELKYYQAKIQVKLNNYGEAYKHLQMLEKCVSHNEKSFKLFVLLSKILGKKINYAYQLELMKENLRSLRMQEYQMQIFNNHQEKEDQKVYKKIAEGKYELNEIETEILRKDGNIDLFMELKVSSQKELIKEKRQFTQRIKASELKQIDFKNMKLLNSINKQKPLCRLDWQSQIVYFDHEEETNQNLSKKITNCVNMMNVKRLEKKSHQYGMGMGMGMY